MRIVIKALLAAAASLIPLALPVAEPPVTLAQTAVACLVPKHDVTQRCFRPGRIIDAEALLPVFPVDPSAAVRAAAGLSLTQVAVFSGPASAYSGVPAGAQGIIYVFGTPPRLHRGLLSLPTPSRPSFVLVSEGIDPRAVPGSSLAHIVCPPKGQPAVEIHGAPDGCGSFWMFHSALISRKLDLTVETNTSGRQAGTIGRAIVRAGKRGK